MHLLPALQGRAEAGSVSFRGEGRSSLFSMTAAWLLPRLCQCFKSAENVKVAGVERANMLEDPRSQVE